MKRDMIPVKNLLKPTYTNRRLKYSELLQLSKVASKCLPLYNTDLLVKPMYAIVKSTKLTPANILCHEYATKHKLPEVNGYYGVTKKGEFVY